MTRNAAFLSALSLQRPVNSYKGLNLNLIYPKEVSGSPDPALTVSFITMESLNPDLKSRVGVCLLNMSSWS